MFSAAFSFKGRIRRLEYGISVIIYLAFSVAMEETNEDWMFLLAIPVLWFFYAQGAKRCHDRNCSGWWQLVPFYPLWMLFAEGTKGPNEYGPDPKNPNLTSETAFTESGTESTMGSDTQNDDINFE
jgi:uncharacterized membrane protein YhaH (DUF805 family)